MGNPGPCPEIKKPEHRYICADFLKGNCSGTGRLSKKCKFIHPPKSWKRSYIWLYSTKTPFRGRSDNNNPIYNQAVPLATGDAIEKWYRKPDNSFYG